MFGSKSPSSRRPVLTLWLLPVTARRVNRFRRGCGEHIHTGPPRLHKRRPPDADAAADLTSRLAHVTSRSRIARSRTRASSICSVDSPLARALAHGA